MLDEAKKSIQMILFERITSPLSGALFFSWFIWNWKILFILFSSDSTLTLQSRLIYVKDNLLNYEHNLLLPIGSALFLVFVYPFATTGTLWIWLRFKKWQRDLRNEIEKRQLLTYEESHRILIQIQTQEEAFQRVLKSKDEEISILRRQLEISSDKDITSNKYVNRENKTSIQDETEWQKEYDLFSTTPQLYDNFKTILANVQGDYDLTKSRIPPDVIGYFTSNNIIKPNRNAKNRGAYELTTKGEYFVKQFTKIKKEYA